MNRKYRRGSNRGRVGHSESFAFILPFYNTGFWGEYYTCAPPLCHLLSRVSRILIFVVNRSKGYILLLGALFYKGRWGFIIYRGKSISDRLAWTESRAGWWDYLSWCLKFQTLSWQYIRLPSSPRSYIPRRSAITFNNLKLRLSLA